MDDKRIEWMGSSRRDLLAMPEEVVKAFGYALGLAQNGMSYPDAKALTQIQTRIGRTSGELPHRHLPSDIHRAFRRRGLRVALFQEKIAQGQRASEA